MKLTLGKIAAHVIIFVAVMVVISALGIWFDTGPVVSSP